MLELMACRNVKIDAPSLLRLLPPPDDARYGARAAVIGNILVDAARACDSDGAVQIAALAVGVVAVAGCVGGGPSAEFTHR